MILRTSLALLLYSSLGSAQQLLPPIQWDEASEGSLQVSELPKTIYLQSSFADTRDTDGLTLIPPSAEDFANTFVSDLKILFPGDWTLEKAAELPQDEPGIYLGSFEGDASTLTYENGQATSEGYELNINGDQIFIGGAGARGLWWGTRTLLQQMVQGDQLISGRTVDVPAYATRGYMLDAGRKWYAQPFLKELCTYASFFKISEFHYHTSDNYPLSRGRNETWQDVYSHFSLMPESEELKPIIERENETLSRADFEDLQTHCAQRGITVIPEIEAPGHCLAITKWKPELALPKRDLLNLTHPDSIPTIKSVWAEFLPWFQTKEVHIGADEYDPDLADDYIRFVNEMSDFVNSTSNKRIRIWGTYEPSDTLTVSKDIVIQHWQYGQSDPVQLDRNGYDLVNSEDWWAYTTLKNDHTPILPAPYPQFFNNNRVLNFANQDAYQWEPALYNPVNISEQLDSTSQRNRGAIMAAWNDNGPDATTQLEAFYSIRNGVPVVASRAWAGSRGTTLDAASLPSSIELFTNNAPGQNLDRALSGVDNTDCSAPLFTWSAPSNGTFGTITIGAGGKGLNHTLHLSVAGPFTLSSPDNKLSLSSDGTLAYDADGYIYPLRSISQSDGYDPGHPGRIFTNVSSSSHDVVRVPITDGPATEITIQTDAIGGSRAWVNDQFAGRFEVFVYGGRNTLFSWSQMAFVAPLEQVQGGVTKLEVWGCLTEGNGTEPQFPPPSSGAGRLLNEKGDATLLLMMIGLITFLLC